MKKFVISGNRIVFRETIDCPQCGSVAYYSDNGIACTNKFCKYYVG